MSTTEPSNTAANRRPWWRRAAAFLFLLFYRTLGTLTIVSALFVAFAQTDLFRDWFKSEVLSLVNSNLEGRLTADDIHVDLFRGIVIDHPVLYANGTVVVWAERLSVSYDLAALFTRVASINEVRLQRPEIKLIRSTDGVWNFSRIALPSTDTTSSDPPDGTLLVRHLWVQGAHLYVNDRSAAIVDSAHFDPLHLELTDLDLSVSARVGMRTHDAALSINGLTFEQVNGPLDVKQLHAVVRATPKGVDVQSFHLELPETDVWARARMDGIDVFEGVGDSLLINHPLVGHVTTSRFYGPDLHYIVPDVDLADHYALDADVKFTGQMLDVTNLTLKGGDAVIKGQCKVMNVDGSKPLAIDITVHDSHARYADVRRRLRFVPLPELPFLETTTIQRIHLKGEPEKSIWFDVQASDKPGSVEGVMTLYLDKPTLGYDVDMRVRNADLSVFDGDSALSTRLNGRVMMVGSGVTLQDLDGTTQIEMDRSMVFGRQVRTFRTIVHGNGQGVITVDTLFADLTPFLDDTLDASNNVYALSVFEPRQLIALSAEIDVADTSLPRYYVDVRTSDVNLARLFNNPALPSMLSSTFIVNARGITLDEFYGSVDGRVDMLVLQDRGLMPFNLDLLSTEAGDRRILKVKSDFGTVSIDGQFQPSSLIGAIAVSTEAIIKAVKRQLRDLSDGADDAEEFVIDVEPLNAYIDIDMKEASPVNLFLSDVYVSGLARLQTRIKCTPNEVSLDVPSLYVEGLQISGDSLEFYADPTSASMSVVVKDLQTNATVRSLNVEGACDSLMIVNGTVLKRPRVSLFESDQSTIVSASSGVNDMRFAVLAKIGTAADRTTIEIDSASFTLDPGKGLTWTLLQPSTIDLNAGIATIQSLEVQRSDGESVRASGKVSWDSFTDASVTVKQFPLSDLSLFVELGKDDPLRLLNGMVNSAAVTINGSWKEPVIDLSLEASGLTYNRAPIGSLSTTIHHENRTVTGRASIVDPKMPDSPNTLDLTIRALPLDLGFEGVEQRLSPNGKINIEASARSLALAAVEPFLPAVESVRGIANGTIAMTGTPTDVQLAGTANFKNGRFLASSTNIVYQAEGTIHLDNSDLVIDSVSIRNLDRDLKGGTALARGVVVFDGLVADSIDFSVQATSKTGVKIMSKASQARSPDIYGDLIVRTGNKPIRLYGKLDSPRLTGDMLIAYSDIVFPQERSTTKARRTSFKYVRQDPSVYGQKSIMDYVREGSPSLGGVPYDSVADDGLIAEQFVASAIKSIVESSSADFVDILKFDLDMYLEGRTLLTMVFGVFEILTADLEQVDRNVPLNFNGSFGDNSTNLRGTVRLKEGASTYKFYKPFRTSGELNFSSGGLTNPSLNLKAVYEDRRVVGDKTEDYKVELAITGTKAKPKINYRVWRKGREMVGDSAKVAGDALMLILVGRTQDELFQEGQGDLVGQVNASLSAVATSALSDVVSDIGIIQNAQLDVGADVSQSRLTVSGQLFGDVSYRVSGQISDFSGNSTFTISMPLSVLADEDALRYLRADFSSTVNNTGNITRQTRLWEIKLGARLP